MKNIPQRIVIYLISLYQLLISPDHSWVSAQYPYGFCRHYPSCSQYAKQSVQKYGLMRGLLKGFIRVLKCNPWMESMYDPA